MHERASGLDLGWDLSLFVDEDCVGRGAIDLGTLLPLDFFSAWSPSLFLSCPWTPHTLLTPIECHGILLLHNTK